DFFLGSVRLGIRHGMSAVTISPDVQERRPVSPACPFESFVSGFGYFDGIHPVHRKGRHFVGYPQLVDVGVVVCALQGSTHGVTIVLTDKNNREFPVHGHVESFMQGSLPCGSVAEEADGHGIALVVFVSESDSGTEGDLPADNAMPAIEIMF